MNVIDNNVIDKIILMCAREHEWLWAVAEEIAQEMKVDLVEASGLAQERIIHLVGIGQLFLLSSNNLFSNEDHYDISSQASQLSTRDFVFRESGPFIYVSYLGL